MDIEVQVFTAGHLSELRLLDRMGEHQQGPGPGRAPSCRAWRSWARGCTRSIELEFWFSLCCVHFGAGEVNKALFWLNKVLNDNEPTLRQDIFTHARLVNLVVHYELGNFDLLEYIVRSTQRFLNKHHRAYEMEVLLIEHIKKLARITGARCASRETLPLAAPAAGASC